MSSELGPGSMWTTVIVLEQCFTVWAPLYFLLISARPRCMCSLNVAANVRQSVWLVLRAIASWWWSSYNSLSSLRLSIWRCCETEAQLTALSVISTCICDVHFTPSNRDTSEVGSDSCDLQYGSTVIAVEREGTKLLGSAVQTAESTSTLVSVKSFPKNLE